MPKTINLSKKDAKFRDFSLNGNIWKVVLSVGTPLALYQSLSQIFKLIDTMMAAHISSASVSTVAYLSQINLMLSALGGGLAIGSSIQISAAYGAGDFELLKKRVSTLFAICSIMSAAVLLVLVPFTPQFLRLAKTPEEFISIGTQYFILDLFGLVITFFNNIYISLERARGNSNRILLLNMLVFVIKLIATAIFIYFLHGGINMIAVATIISQSVLLAAAIINLCKADNAFSFSPKHVEFKRPVVWPMIHLSIPVIIEKGAFSFGKVVINSMSTIYNSLTVGALGISNNIGGLTTNPQNGFQEGGAAIISQNLGGGKPKRALKVFWATLIVCVIIGAFFMSISLFFLNHIVYFFAGNDTEFAKMIASIYKMEALGSIPLGVTSAVTALLYGFGKTKLTLLLNFSRVFIFRIPVLWFLQNFTDYGNVSVGIVMGVSNVSIGIMAAIIGLIEIRNICHEYQITPF